MTMPLKIASGVVTALLVAGAIVIGGGHPVSPARIARTTSEAAANAAQAERNTNRAAESTRALVTIAENVESQVRSSRRLLEIQLRLEKSARDGTERSRDLQKGIEEIRRALVGLRSDIAALTELSARTVSSGQAAAGAGDAIEARLRVLENHFEEVIKQSRRLNRKARGYDRARGGPR